MNKLSLLLVALAMPLAACSADGGPIPAPFRSVPTTFVDSPGGSGPTVGLAATPTLPATPTDAPVPLPVPSATRQVARANDLANLRAGPGTEHPIVGQAQPGQELDVVASNAGRTWLQLAGGQWIFAELVDGAPAVPLAGTIPTAPPPTSTPTPRPPTPVPTATHARAVAQPTVSASGSCKISAGYASIRTGPGTGYDIRMLVSQGMQMQITGRNAAGDWLAVTVVAYGATGWIFAEYCRG